MKMLSRIRRLGLKAAIGALLVLCSTAGVAWSDPITLAISPDSGTLTLGDKVTVTFTVDPSQLSYPAAADQLRYIAGVHFHSLIFALDSENGAADAGDSAFFSLDDPRNHDAFTSFEYIDRSPFRSEFTFVETFTAIQGTRGHGLPLPSFLVIASAWYRLEGKLVNSGVVQDYESYDVTPHVPEPGALTLLFTSAAFAAWRRKRQGRRALPR